MLSSTFTLQPGIFLFHVLFSHIRRVSFLSAWPPFPSFAIYHACGFKVWTCLMLVLLSLAAWLCLHLSLLLTVFHSLFSEFSLSLGLCFSIVALFEGGFCRTPMKSLCMHHFLLKKKVHVFKMRCVSQLLPVHVHWRLIASIQVHNHLGLFWDYCWSLASFSPFTARTSSSYLLFCFCLRM